MQTKETPSSISFDVEEQLLATCDLLTLAASTIRATNAAGNPAANPDYAKLWGIAVALEGRAAVLRGMYEKVTEGA